MRNGILIEEMSKDDLILMFQGLTQRIEKLEAAIVNNTREDVTLSELSRMKGYGKAQLRHIIKEKKFPITYEGRELLISRENAGKIRSKVNKIKE